MVFLAARSVDTLRWYREEWWAGAGVVRAREWVAGGQSGDGGVRRAHRGLA